MSNKNSNEKVKNNKIIMFFKLVLIVIIISCIAYISNWYMENRRNAKLLDNIASSSILSSIQINIPINSEDNDINNVSNSDGSDSTKTAKITTYKLDFNYLLSVNSSTTGWINVPGTCINYPVVQASDNSFYLNHSFDKSKNNAGWIFADYRNQFDGTDKNIIIYGHNRMDTSMFATLKNTQKKNWLNNKNNHYISFTTPTRSRDIRSFFCLHNKG